MARTTGPIIVVIFIILFVRTWLLLGVFEPLRVESSSMVPAFYGPRHVLSCVDCGVTFQCGCDGPESKSFLTCPECGFAENPIGSALRKNGDALLVDKWTFAFRNPKRFESVLFPSPETPGELTLKRIVGLPGERVSFQNGTMSIDGKILSRPLGLSCNQTVGSPPGIWIDESDSSRYCLSYYPKSVTPHFKSLHKTVVSKKNESDTVFPPSGKSKTSDRAYNQLWTLSSENLENPRHWGVCFDISGMKDLRVLISNDNGTTELNLSQLKKCTVTAAVVDCRIGLALDGKIVTNLPIDGGVRTENAPIVISCIRESQTNPLLKLKNVKIFNPSNVHAKNAAENEWIVPPDHYFVLGDNYPISQDSRTWSDPFVHKGKIIGKARKW